MREHVILSDGDGAFSGSELVGLAYTRALSFAVDRLKASDFARCGLHGVYKLMIVAVESGVWAVLLFLADEPSGGASILTSGDLRETLSEEIRFDFDPNEDPWDSELFDVLLANEGLFDAVFFK